MSIMMSQGPPNMNHLENNTTLCIHEESTIWAGFRGEDLSLFLAASAEVA